MAVTYVGVSATATPAGTLTTAGTAAVSPSLPAGTASGDRVFLYQASSNTSGTAPTGWTQLYKDVQVGVTGTAPGAGTGRRYISAYWRDYDGAWTMPTLTLTSATQNSNAAAAMALHKGTGDTWDTPTFSTPGHDTTSGTGWSVTVPSFTTVAGALLMTHSGHTAGGGSASGQNLTQTGATLANIIERYDNGTTTGNDVRLVFGTADVTTGATATLLRTATLTVAGTGGTCVVQQTVTAAPTGPQGPPQTVYVYPSAITTGSNTATGAMNVAADDGVYATITATANVTIDNAWDFPAASLPTDATLTGVAIEHEVRFSTASGWSTWANLYDTAWATLTTVMDPGDTTSPTTDTVRSRSVSGPTKAQLSAPTRVQLAFWNAAAGTVTVDFLRLAITYTQPAAAGQDLQSTASSSAGATDSHSWTLTSDVMSSASSSAGAVDSVSTMLTAQRSPVDTAGAVDTVSTALTASRAATDTAGVTDTATWSVAGTPGAGETFGITGTSTTLSGLTPGKKYTLQVRSREPQSVSAWSDPVEFTTTTALPTGSAVGTLVSTDSTTAVNPDARLGINANMWEDNQARRPNGSRTLSAALNDLKPKIMRYPGGEKSDNTTFFQAANQGAAGQAGPNPRINRFGPTSDSSTWPSTDANFWTPLGDPNGNWVAGRPPYALQTFLADCATVGAEPLIVCGLDGIYLPQPTGGVRPTKAQMITNAVEMVRWLNVTNSYGVKYFEIGNETWQVVSWGGGLGSTFANGATYGTDVADVAAAMKAVDPTIQVGANIYQQTFNDGFLSTAAAAVDFVTVHPYDTYGMTYTAYQAATLSAFQINEARASLDKLPAQHRDRIWITVSETAHLAASNTDANGYNNLGSAIITAHFVAMQMADQRARHVTFWNTRYIFNTQTNKLAYDALAPDNTLLPSGRALQFLGQLSGRMVPATAGTAGTGLIAYASQVASESRSSVLIVNRTATTRTGTVGMAGAASVTVRQLTGTGPTDTAPALNTLSGVTVIGGVTSSISCPANSLTLLDFGY